MGYAIGKWPYESRYLSVADIMASLPIGMLCIPPPVIHLLTRHNFLKYAISAWSASTSLLPSYSRAVVIRDLQL